MAVRTVKLAGTGVQTTALGFGCANLFRLPGARQRAEVLRAAYDAGVRHYDVAPMYGLGLAESEVGRFAGGRRAGLTIATKFGIGATPLARGLARAQGPARGVLEAFPALRRHAREKAAGPGSGRMGALLYTSEGYDAAGARKSLERSLRALRTDYVDILLLHDPDPGSVRSDDVRSYLESARSDGLIRGWGVAGEPGPTLAVARSLPAGAPVLQVRDNIWLRSPRAAAGASALITFGILGGVLASLLTRVTSDRERLKRWNATIGADFADPEVAASLLLRAALLENRGGVVLFSTVRPRRIQQAAAAAQAGEPARDPSLGAFLELVAAEFAQPALPVEGAP
ncbi:MAG TPA: aldo/keto reductase [Streptosporangiaceae bacterium]|nr:aldo/keto reductase [Streptosporangiaceae bacterium]